MPEPTTRSLPPVADDSIPPPRPTEEQQQAEPNPSALQPPPISSSSASMANGCGGAPVTRSQASQLGGGGGGGSSGDPRQHHNVAAAVTITGRSSNNNSSCGGDIGYLREYQEGARINVGPEYQAVLPEYNPDKWSDSYKWEEKEGRRESLCLWSPPPDGGKDIDLSDAKVWEYVVVAKNAHAFNQEQALGLLQTNEYDAAKALKVLAEYKTVPEDWTANDQIVFEQAFAFNGKCFRRIRQMMPDKTVADLVQYYYQWKKKQKQQQRPNAAAAVESFVEREYERTRSSGASRAGKFVFDPCENCRVRCVQLQDTPKGRLCTTCFLRWRRTGDLNRLKIVKADGGDLDTNDTICSDDTAAEALSGKKPDAPVEMALHVGDFLAATPATSKNVQIAAPPSSIVNSDDASAVITPTQRIASLRKLEQAITQLRAQAYENRAKLGGGAGSIAARHHRAKLFLNDVSYLRVERKRRRRSTSWSTYEQLLAQKGFCRYGRDFAAVAEIVGTKNMADVKRFYDAHKDTLKLEESEEDDEEEEKKENLE